ncbi:MAG: mannose-1-phosphate guanylyltransferase [Ignavibacteriales bacterium]|nr:mannose-1-phosphate guanylyltransferase [Ignavibacteriales bacterium]
MNVYAVIMAGGVGSRFWPRSREKSPKQLLKIFGEQTMLQNTVRRLENFIPPSKVLIITNKIQKPLVEKQLPNVPEQNIIPEPFGRNTAPCIGLAATMLKQIDEKAVMVVLPADHLIRNEEEFLRIIKLATETAYESESLLTIGITPTHPETGFGYIQFVDTKENSNPYFEKGIFHVKTFAEKPNLETAKQFLASGDFLWNSGMFVWRVDVILREIQQHLPEMFTELTKLEYVVGDKNFPMILENVYKMIRGVSIDYGVMEKAKSVFVIPGNFGWSDVGSWDEVVRLSGKDETGNSVNGKSFLRNAKNIFIDSKDKFVAVIGLDDVIVVNTDDAVLICKKDQSQEVKEVVDYLKRKQLNEFL